MSSEKQITANRKNATKSTGPKTPEGKAKVAQNATKHGLTATTDVIKGESQEQFDAHKQGFLDALNPKNAVENFLADRIVNLAWRLKRAERIQNQFLTAMQIDLPYIVENYRLLYEEPSYHDPNLTLGAAVNRDFTGDKVLDRLTLYERRIENSFTKCLNTLQNRKRRSLAGRPLTPEALDMALLLGADLTSCHPELDSGPQHPGKEPTREHPSGTSLKKQNQFSTRDNTTSLCEKDAYNPNPRPGETPIKPNNPDSGAPQEAPRRTYKTGVRRY